MKKLLNYSCYIIIILIGVFDILYGVNYEVKQFQILKNYKKTTASIYQTTNREDGKQVLYINFYLKNKKYDGVLVLKEKTTNQSTITIFYDENNPVNFTTGEIDNSGYTIIILGVVFILVGIMVLLKDLINARRCNDAIN